MPANELVLVGKSLVHSFSKAYFSDKFTVLGLSNWDYQNFEIQAIEEIVELRKHKNLKGFNITIPYKLAVFPYLDKIDKHANAIGAVNTVLVAAENNKVYWHGYNTDWLAFKTTISPFCNDISKALVLGTGGASKAIIYALESLGIEVLNVGRNTAVNYDSLNQAILQQYQLIVNTTPLGTFPEIDEAPNLPYAAINKNHICYDLVYNPTETLFLRQCKNNGALVLNGLQMLELQADLAWDLWSENRA